MEELMLRDSAPFGHETWERIDTLVVSVMKSLLVGRRFIDLVGPLGWGVEQAPIMQYGTEDEVIAAGEATGYIPLHEWRHDFILRGKHLAVAAHTPYGLDLGPAAIAAQRIARDEDMHLIGGLIERAGTDAPLGDWGELGGPFAAVSEGIARLREAGFPGPYALVMSPSMYARLASLMQHGHREIQLVESVAKIYQARSIDQLGDQVLLLSLGAWNFDVVVGQDATVAYMGNERLDHLFRVFETLALRVKRPGAICVLRG